MMNQLTRYIYRILFIASFLLAGFCVWEKLANQFGLTLLRDLNPWRLLELSAVGMLFVIALQLRQIKMSSETKGSS